MIFTPDNPDPPADLSSGPPCPDCGDSLVLVVEPGIAEFCCPQGHSSDVAALLEKQAQAARHALEEALTLWQTRYEKIAWLAEEARVSGQSQRVALWEHRLLVIDERVRMIRRTLARTA